MGVNGTNYSIARGPWRLLPTVLISTAIIFVFYAMQAFSVTVFVVGFNFVSPVPANTQHLTQTYLGLLVSLGWLAAGPLFIWLILYAIHKRSGPPAWLYLAVHPFSFRQLLTWLGILAAFIVASAILTNWLGRPQESAVMMQVFRTAGFPLLLWLVIVVLAPIFEELLFRGFLYRGIEFSRLGTDGAIIITALGWSLIHASQYDGYQVATVFAIGMLLGYARARSGSVVLTIVLHAANNLVAMMQMAYTIGHGS